MLSNLSKNVLLYSKSCRMFSAFSDEQKQIVLGADCFCFDVDSTVCQDEAIDELAKFAGVYDEVSAVTKLSSMVEKAMEGNLNFREAFEKRLDIIQPTQQMFDKFVTSKPPHFSPGIEELMKLLNLKSKAIFLVSGGFREVIKPVASSLNISFDNIIANEILFNKIDGSYNGYDKNEPTSSQDGKIKVMRSFKYHENFKSIIMIGDGATDLEVKDEVDMMIGYGGIQTRQKVKEGCSVWITDFDQISTLFQE